MTDYRQLNQNVSSFLNQIAQNRQAQTQRKQGMEDLYSQERIKAMVKQQYGSPIETILNMAKLAEALGITLPELMGQYGQGQTAQPTAQPAMQEPTISPTTRKPLTQTFNQFSGGEYEPGPEAEMTMLGTLRPKTFVRKGGAERKLKTKVSEQVGAQRGKDILKTGQDVGRMEAAVGAHFSAWLDNIKWNYDEYGLKPGGIVGGLTSKLVGSTRKNPHWEAFHGAAMEYGAAIARIAMPGTRSIRSVNMFKKSASSDWSTVESGVKNIATSLRSAIGKDMAIHEEEYLDVLGQDFMGLKPNEKFGRKQDYLDSLSEAYQKTLYEQIFAKEPMLVPEPWRVKIMQSGEWEAI